MEQLETSHNGVIAPHQDEAIQLQQVIQQGWTNTIQENEGEVRSRWQWQLAALGFAGLAVILAGLLAWKLLTAAPFIPMIQLVQVTAENKVEPVGLPKDILAYTPEEAQWRDMLGQWVRQVRQRTGHAPSMQAAWIVAEHHTCDVALKTLQAYHEQEKPFENLKLRVAVNILGIHKLAAGGYTVTWEETRTEHQRTVQQWTATFTVGRVRPPTPEFMRDNHAGLCVTWFDWDQTS